MYAASRNLEMRNDSKRLAALSLIIASVLFCGLSFLSLWKVESQISLLWLSILNGNANLIVAFLIWAALVLSWLQWRFGASFVIFIAFILLIGTFLLFVKRESYLGGIALNKNQYHLISKYDWDYRWYTYSLCECNSMNLACRCHDFYGMYSPIISVNFSLEANEITEGVVVRLNSDPIYEFGNLSEECYPHSEVIDVCYDN